MAIVVIAIACLADAAAGAPALRKVARHDVAVHAADGRVVPVRIFAPARGCRRCALILFSHGTYSDYAHYDSLLEDWAGHGMVVAAPLHVDSEAYPERARFTREDSRTTRVADMAAVDAALRPGQAPLVKGVTYSGAVFAAGHSYGALIAEVIGGAEPDREAGARIVRGWRPPIAVAAISPPGAMPGFVSEQGWAATTQPTLVVTGTTDIMPPYFDRYQVHLASYRAMPGGVGYALIFAGMDHTFNGAFWKPAPAGERAPSAVADLNLAILRFFADAQRRRLPTPAQWRACSGPGITAAAR